MNRAFNFAIAAVTAATIAASVVSVRAERTADHETPIGATQWFSDEHTTAYYRIDKINSELVATIFPSTAGGNIVEVRRKLRFNDMESITVRGQGPNAASATLLVKHSGADILSRVRTDAEATARTN